MGFSLRNCGTIIIILALGKMLYVKRIPSLFKL